LARLAIGAPVPTDTFRVTTPGAGATYVRAPAGLQLRNTQCRLGWRVDTRAHAGYVLAAGSIRPQGRYRVSHPGPVRPLPASLVEALTAPPPATQPATPPPGRSGRAASRAAALPAGRTRAYLRAIVEGEPATVAAAMTGNGTPPNCGPHRPEARTQ
jgi:hypothetical protein